MNDHPKKPDLFRTYRLAAIGGSLVLLAVAALVWIGVDFGSNLDSAGVRIAESEYFSNDYRTARDRFRARALEAGGRPEILPLEATGPDGEDLSIDIAWFGSESPRRVLLHISGTHGVEAFAGSAIQLGLIEDLPVLPEDMAIVFVHVLNPYGMAWLRRFNENNVDLNRNFLPNGEAYRGHPEGYGDLDDFLNPTRLSAVDMFPLRAAWLILRHGRPTLEAAVVAGQYDYPKGLFFGGHEPQPSVRLYSDFLVRNLGPVEKVFAIDVHTGLGPFGEDTVLVSQGSYDRLRTLLGERVQAFSSDEGNVAYEIRGGHHSGVETLLDGVEVDFVGQEFGTYGQVRVLGALRKENYVHQHGDGDVASPHKTNLRATFYPADPDWRGRVLVRGKELFDQGVAVLLNQ